MTQLAAMAPAYRREVATPGGFAAAFPDVDEAEIAGQLADAFAAAQLDGFFGTYEVDLEAGEIIPDLSPPGQALVVIYAGMRTVRALIRAARTHTRYEAKGVVYEVDSGASVLAELLKDMAARRRELLAAASRAQRATYSYVLDAYGPRSIGSVFAAEELPRAAIAAP